MYLDEIYSDNSITYICDKCGYMNSTGKNTQQIFKTFTENICILQDNEILVCEKCKNTHNSETPLIKVRSQLEDTIPCCPTCGSSNIHKISALNKVGSVATFGILATGHVSKIFKCDSCGMKF